MLALRPMNLHWIEGDDDDPQDQCAHGQMYFAAEGVEFVDPSTGPWNLTAAGLFLLRTLTADHSADHPVAEANFLIPCCGHNPWLVGEGEYPLVCIGCNSGIDVEIVHTADSIVLRRGEKVAAARPREWENGVLGFVKVVEDFYARSSPKAEPQDESLDRPGWAAFWREWRERKSQSAT